AWSFELAEDCRRPAAFKQASCDSAPPHHLEQLVCVQSDVGSVRSDVRNREQLFELFQNRELVGFAIVARCIVGKKMCLIWQWGGQCENQGQKASEHRDFT